MSKPLPVDQLRALAPQYTIAGLFESGRLGAADETALEEIRRIRSAFAVMVNPSRGWMSPQTGGSQSPTPRILGTGPAWRRYVAWRARHSRQLVPASPGRPWGLTEADIVVMAVCEPGSLTSLSVALQIDPTALVHRFVDAVRDYGSEIGRDKARFWAKWASVDREQAVRKRFRRRQKTAARVAAYRKRKKSEKVTLKAPLSENHGILKV